MMDSSTLRLATAFLLCGLATSTLAQTAGGSSSGSSTGSSMSNGAGQDTTSTIPSHAGQSMKGKARGGPDDPDANGIRWPPQARPAASPARTRLFGQNATAGLMSRRPD